MARARRNASNARPGSVSAKAFNAEEPGLIRRRRAFEDGGVQLERPEDAFAAFLEVVDVGEGEPRPERGQRAVVRHLDAGEPGAFLAILREPVALEGPHQVPDRPQLLSIQHPDQDLSLEVGQFGEGFAARAERRGEETP